MLFSNSRGDVISLIFKVAGYTYGPLLGLYLFGMFTKIIIIDKWIPVICIFAPLLTYLLSEYFSHNFNFDFGFMNIAVNAIFTVVGLVIVKRRN